MKLQNDLGNDKISSLVLKLAVPTMIAQFVNVLYSIVDRMYIGNIAEIGELALAGVGVCGPIVTLLSSFATLIGLGGAPIMAMRLGQQNKRGAQLILSNAFGALLILSAALPVIFFIWKEKLLLLFGASDITLVYANEYMTVYALGTVFALLATGLNSFIICQGFSTVAMSTVLIGAVFNIVLDPVFIFIFNMGVRGAAVATVISQAASCFFVVAFLLRRTTPVRITFGGYSSTIIKNIVKFGFCPFIIIATDSVLLIVMNISLKQYGGAQADVLIAAATIMQSFLMLITMPLGGITGGTQPILSYNYGAQNTARIRQGVKSILIMALIFNTAMFVISRVAAGLFAGIFTRDPIVIELAVRAIKVTTLGIIPLAVQYTLVDALTAIGITNVSVSLSLLRKVTYLTTTLLLPIWFGAAATFYAEPAADFLGCAVTTVVFLLVFGRVMAQREAMPADSKLFE